MTSLSDYYDFEPHIGQKITFTSPRTGVTATFTLKSKSEGGCSTGHCSHCAGWLIENVPIEHFDTHHKDSVANGYSRNYCEPPIYHEQEANEILENHLASADYNDPVDEDEDEDEDNI
jgi:hypothetical protein